MALDACRRLTTSALDSAGPLAHTAAVLSAGAAGGEWLSGRRSRGRHGEGGRVQARWVRASSSWPGCVVETHDGVDPEWCEHTVSVGSSDDRLALVMHGLQRGVQGFAQLPAAQLGMGFRISRALWARLEARRAR